MIRVFFIIEKQKSCHDSLLAESEVGCHRLCGTDTGAVAEPVGRRAGVGLWDVWEIFCGFCLEAL